MARRKTPRLAYSEYVSLEPNSTQVWQARLRLIDAATRVFPKFLKKLSADVFPAYAELAKSGFDFDAVLWHPRLPPHTMIPETSWLKSALSEWAGKFHAEPSWLLDETLRTLRGWYVAPDWRKSLRWNPIGGITSTLAMGERFQFVCEGWEMQLLTWADYRQSVLGRFELKLAEYEAASRNLAESHGLVRARRKYSPDNFEWFVLYQFAGLSSIDIVRRSRKVDSLNESTVLKGIKAAAKLIGWQRLRAVHEKKNRKIR